MKDFNRYKWTEYKEQEVRMSGWKGKTWCGLTWGQGECWRWSEVGAVPTPGCLGHESSTCICLHVLHHPVRLGESQGRAAAEKKKKELSMFRVRFSPLTVCEAQWLQVLYTVSQVYFNYINYCLLNTRCRALNSAILGNITCYVSKMFTFCGASCSGTSQSSSEAAGSCMPSNCLSKPMATDSAELDWRKDGELKTQKEGNRF